MANATSPYLNTPTRSEEVVRAGRLVPKNAGPFERFQVGDNVAHIRLGDGVITGNTGIVITVTYDQRYRDNIVALGGKPIIQRYNAGWFHSNPKFLFHRGTVTP